MTAACSVFGQRHDRAGGSGYTSPCRLIFGYDYRRLIPSSILLIAAFLILVDDLARTVTTSEIPLGVLTAFVAPLSLCG